MNWAVATGTIVASAAQHWNVRVEGLLAEEAALHVAVISDGVIARQMYGCVSCRPTGLDCDVVRGRVPRILHHVKLDDQIVVDAGVAHCSRLIRQVLVAARAQGLETVAAGPVAGIYGGGILDDECYPVSWIAAHCRIVHLEFKPGGESGSHLLFSRIYKTWGAGRVVEVDGCRFRVASATICEAKHSAPLVRLETSAAIQLQELLPAGKILIADLRG